MFGAVFISIGLISHRSSQNSQLFGSLSRCTTGISDFLLLCVRSVSTHGRGQILGLSSHGAIMGASLRHVLHAHIRLIAKRTKQKAGRMISGLLLACIGGGHGEAGRDLGMAFSALIRLISV